MGNTDPDHRMGQHCVAICIDANLKGEYYNRTGRLPFFRACVNFMKKHCHSWTYNTVRVQEDVTRLLEKPVEATTIIQNFVLLLVKHVL